MTARPVHSPDDDEFVLTTRALPPNRHGISLDEFWQQALRALKRAVEADVPLHSSHTPLEKMIMTTPILGSILIGSTNPERLRSWYKAAFAPDQPESGPLQVGAVILVFNGRTDVADETTEPGRTIVNFHVEDAPQAVVRLNELGVTWLVELEQRPGGKFATLVDPDGSYVQIIELT